LQNLSTQVSLHPLSRELIANCRRPIAGRLPSNLVPSAPGLVYSRTVTAFTSV
jgi:hypothetical protein